MVTDTKELIDVFHNTSVEIYESKKRALQEGSEELASHIGQGKDLISILSTSDPPFITSNPHKNSSVRENMKASEEEKLSEAEVLGQLK